MLPFRCAAGKLLQAEELALCAADAAGCADLDALAARQQSSDHADSAEGSSLRGDPGSGGSGSLDLRQLAAEAAEARECLEQLAAERKWSTTRSGGLKVLYHHERGNGNWDCPYGCMMEGLYHKSSLQRPGALVAASADL